MQISALDSQQTGLDKHDHLIFLISLPRSGSTLLQRILSGNKHIHSTAETWLMLHPLHTFKTKHVKAIYDQNLAASAGQDFISFVPEKMDLFYHAARRYGLTLYNRSLELSGKQRFLDKTPRYYMIIPELFQTFPEARYIILLRNPLSVFSSVVRTWFANDPSRLKSTSHERDLIAGPQLLIDGIGLLKDKAAVVHYEDLVSCPSDCVKGICDYLDIPFSDEMLEYGKRKPPRGKFGDTVGIHRHDHPVSDNMNQWIRHCSEPTFGAHAAEYLEKLGELTVTQLGYDYIEIKSALAALLQYAQNGDDAFPVSDASKSFMLSEANRLPLLYDHMITSLQTEDPDRILESITTFSIDHPNFPKAQNDLGVLYCNTLQYDKALAHYRKAVAMDPENSVFQKNLADFLLIVKKDVQSAISIYTNLLNNDPQDIEVLYALGHASSLMGNYKDAVSHFEQVIRIEPGNQAAVKCLGELKRRLSKTSVMPESTDITLIQSSPTKCENRITDGSAVRVSAVVSTYASERFIRGRLQNLVEQTLYKKGGLEIIVVDSNSPENERAVVEQFASQYPHVVYHRSTERETVYAAWNRGIAMARGTYFVNANTDDRFAKDALEAMANALDLNPEYEAAYGNWVVTRTPNDTFDSNTPKRLFNYPDFHPGLFFYLQITSHANFIRRSLFEKIGTFNGSYTVFGDREFMLRLAESGFKALKLQQIIGLYFENPTSVERANKNIGRKECNALYDHYLAPERFASLMGFDAHASAKQLSHGYTLVGCLGMRLYDIAGTPVHALGTPARMFPKAIELDPKNIEALNNMGVIAQHLESPQLASGFLTSARLLADSKQVQIIDHNLKLTEQNIVDPNQLQFLFPRGFRPIRIIASPYQGDVNFHPQPSGKSTSTTFALEMPKRDMKRGSRKSITSSSSETSQKYFSCNHTFGGRKNSIDRDIWSDYLQEDYSSADSALSKILFNDPDHWQAYILLVDVMLQSGQQKVIPDRLRHLEERSNLPASVMALIGSGYEATGDLDRAAQFADRALALDNGCARAWNLKGVLVYRNDQPNEAALHFQKATESDAAWGEPWTNLGTICWEKQDRDKALDCFEKGFELSPTAPNVATSYHAAVSETGQYERARPMFEKIVEDHPDFRRARFLLIDILIRLGAYQAALDQIEAVLVRFGADPQLLEAAKAVRAKVGPMTIKMGKSPSLSLCMIVKNEEKYLPRCLESLKPLVDQMIIVDTGSNDATREIAEIFGALVFDFEWNDDFAAARNYSLDQATGDWILVMDADEVIAASDHKKLRSLIEDNRDEKVAFLITTRNYTTGFNGVGWIANDGGYEDLEAGCGWIPSTKSRLFRNTTKIRFEYTVHELVDSSLERNSYRIVPCDVPVHHYGVLDAGNVSQKGALYKVIAKQTSAAMKNDPKVLKELAVRSSMLGAYEEAIDYWNRLLKVQPKNAYAYINISAAYDKLGRYPEAKEAALKAIVISPDTKEGYLNFGRSELLLGNYSNACKVLNKIIGRSPDYYPAVFLLGAAQICDGQIRHGLATIRRLKPLSIWNTLSHAFNALAKDLNKAGLALKAQCIIASTTSLIFEENNISDELLGSSASPCGTHKIAYSKAS